MPEKPPLPESAEKSMTLQELETLVSEHAYERMLELDITDLDPEGAQILTEWKGEQFFDGDNFQIDLDMFFDEMWTLHGVQFEKWQKYVWATTEEPIIKGKDAEDVYRDDLDELDSGYDWEANGVKNLQEALDKFVKANEKNIAYHPDYKIAPV